MLVVTLDDGRRVGLQPGDTLDLSDGLIEYHKEPEATAVRTLLAERRRGVRQAIKHVKDSIRQSNQLEK